MDIKVLLNEYENLIKKASSISEGAMKDRKERTAWDVFKFLVKCGVNKSELLKIEAKYNY
jgi:hypothetical protein